MRFPKAIGVGRSGSRFCLLPDGCGRQFSPQRCPQSTKVRDGWQAAPPLLIGEFERGQSTHSVEFIPDVETLDTESVFAEPSQLDSIARDKVANPAWDCFVELDFHNEFVVLQYLVARVECDVQIGLWFVCLAAAVKRQPQSSIDRPFPCFSEI